MLQSSVGGIGGDDCSVHLLTPPPRCCYSWLLLRDAQDSGDAQDFLDKMINQASPEGVNGEPSTLFTMNLNSNPITTQANVRRTTTAVLLFEVTPPVS